MRRALRYGLGLAAGLLLSAATPTAAGPDGAPRIAALIPERQAAVLACRIRTAGLPTDRALASMQGGLPAAVDLVIDVVDDRDQRIGRREVAFRIAFDLWEEVFRLDGAGFERRFGTVDSLRAALRDLDPLPVVPLDRMGAGQRYRFRVELLEHAIAPSQKARVGRLLAGEAPRPGGGGEHEVSFGVGRIIEFFYGREPDAGAPRTVGLSAWFTREEVGHGTP